MTEQALSILIVVLTLGAVLAALGPVSLRRWLGVLIPALDPRRFACRVLLFEEGTAAGCRDVLKIQIQGAIRAPYPNCDTDLLIQLTDATDKQTAAKPVLCRRPEWSSDGTPAHQYRFHNGILPARVSVLKDWVTITEIGAWELVFPRRGPAVLECEVTVLDKMTGKVLASARNQVPLLSEHFGYEEIQQQRLAKQQAMRHITAAVWQMTAPNPTGKEILERWLQERKLPPAEQMEPLSGEQAAALVQDACEQLAGYAEPAECCSILEICMRIAACGSGIPQPLLNLLQTIAAKLEIPKNRWEALVQKYLSRQAEHIQDPMLLLGLHEGMTGSQILEKLTSEYRKWNARVTHPDPAVRKQADQMLNLIAQCRSRFARQASGNSHG
ncbi:MAG TPA: hypothetical protein PK054_11655 [Anaerohalosphaeraceae bacterium]|nr:hypothetical protein [Anaerohalosphaeraceae bacterium]HOL89631.1 hypothetical protein [Anaerohalosphaeraceae bacterium]HPP57219.1 hypothetical protein [Anaerohalosphaeraceae bacterium]